MRIDASLFENADSRSVPRHLCTGGRNICSSCPSGSIFSGRDGTLGVANTGALVKSESVGRSFRDHRRSLGTDRQEMLVIRERFLQVRCEPRIVTDYTHDLV